MKLPAPKFLAFVFRLALGLFLLIIGIGVFLGLKNAAPELETADPGDRTLRVQVFEATAVVLPRQWRGFGTTRAEDTTDVPTRVGTTVVDIPDDIEVGRAVTQGQVLAELGLVGRLPILRLGLRGPVDNELVLKHARGCAKLAVVEGPDGLLWRDLAAVVGDAAGKAEKSSKPGRCEIVPLLAQGERGLDGVVRGLLPLLLLLLRFL